MVRTLFRSHHVGNNPFLDRKRLRFVLLLEAPCGLSQVLEAKKGPAQSDMSGEGLPPGAVLRLGTTHFRHADPVLSVAFSPNGKLLASSDASGVVHVWDADTGKPLLDLPKNTGSLVLFTSDGKNLVCSREKKGTFLLNAVTGETVRTYVNKEQDRSRGRSVQSTHTIALSPDGRMLAEADGQEVVLWEVTTGKELFRLKGDKTPFGSVAFAHDSKTVAAGEDDKATTIYFWDTKTGEQTHKIANVHGGWTTALTFSADGKLFASASPYEVAIWDAATRKKLTKFDTGSPSLAFSPDGKFLAGPQYGGGEAKGTIHVYDTAALKSVQALRGHLTIVNCVAFSPNGKKIATGGPEGTVRLWDAMTGRQLSTGDGNEALINSVAFSPDGSFAATASGGDHTIRIWGTASGAQLAKIDIPCQFPNHWCATSHGWNLAFGADGKTVTCDSSIYDIVGRRLLGDLPGRVLAHSADGKFMAGVVYDRNDRKRGTVSVWDRATGRELASFQPLAPEAARDTSISAAAFSPDGRLLAVGVDSRDYREKEMAKDSVYLYQVATGKVLHKFRPVERGPHSLLFSPDGRLLVAGAGWEESIQLWRVADGGLQAQLRGEEQRLNWPEYRPIAFSPNGMFLASGGKDNSIVIWDMLSGVVVHRLSGHEYPVRALAYPPDGRRLLSAGSELQAVLWNVAPPVKKADLSDKDLERLWGELGSDNAEAAYRAAGVLAATPDKALPLFKEKLKPLASPDLTRVPRLLADLDNEALPVRDAAFKELGAFGSLIEDTLRKTLDGKPSLEVRKRVEMLLSEIQQRPLPMAQLQQFRAVQVLEWIDTPAAVALLEPLARGTSALRITHEAETTLRRLGNRRSVPVEKPAPSSKPAQATEPRKLPGLTKEITSIAYTANGQFLVAVAADGKVRLFDASGKELRTFQADDTAVYAVAFSPDGKMLATAGKDQSIHLWEPRKGESLGVLKGHTGTVTSLAFAPDGKVLASGSLDTTVRLWDPSTGQAWLKSKGCEARVTSVAFSHDGKTLAAGLSDEGVNTVAGVPFPIYQPQMVRFWQLPLGETLEAHPRQGHLVAFSPDGKNVATAGLMTELLVGGEGGIRVGGKGNVIGAGQGEATIKGYVSIAIRDRVSGQLRGRFAGNGAALAFSPDGRYLATARGSDIHMGGKILDAPETISSGGRLRLWEIESGKEVLGFPEAIQPTVLAFSPDRRTLAAGMKDGGVLLCDLAPANKDAPPDEFRRTDFERLWDALASEDAGAVYRALWQLRAAGGKALPFLAERLKPTPADDPALLRLLANLDAETFAVREAASKELERLGADAEPALCRALPKASSPAVRARILLLLNAPGIVQHNDAIARQRAIAALEGIGSIEARTLLTTLAQGPPLVPQTQAASQALERLKRP